MDNAMAAEWVEVGKDVLKLAVRARYSFAIWVICLLILVVPLPSALGLDGVGKDYAKVLGFTCLAAFVLWIVEVGLLFTAKAKTYFDEKSLQDKILKHLDSLNAGEANLLFTAASTNTQTVIWAHTADAVGSLVAKQLLIAVPSIEKSPYHTRPVTVPRFVWDEIKNQEVLARLKTLSGTEE